MNKRHSIGRKLLAASAVALVAATSAQAAPSPSAAHPTEIAAPLSHAADQDRAAPGIAERAGLAAAATAALATFIRLVGAARLLGWLRAGAPVAKKAARAAVRAPAAAARAVGRAAAAPMKLILAFAGVGLFALSGLSLFHIEWAGGLLAGAALVVLAWLASARARRAMGLISGRNSPPHQG